VPTPHGLSVAAAWAAHATARGRTESSQLQVPCLRASGCSSSSTSTHLPTNTKLVDFVYEHDDDKELSEKTPRSNAAAQLWT
jgi:hypothetical protein